MSLDRKTVRPIIVIKKKVSHGGHHGGAWKVAYADFVTAMMSLFIVLWLMNSTPQIKKAVAGYFNDPKSGGRETGTTVLGSNKSISIDQKNVQKLKQEIEKAILKQTDLSKLSKQIVITITSEGLKIDLIEDKGGTFFETGSAKLSPSGVELLDLLATQLKVLPNRLLIEGHTDAQPYVGNSDYTNWELSADRANTARRVLQQGGVGPNQVSQVRGYGDQMLRVPSNPFDATNRRVSLIVQWQDASAPAANAAKVPGTANTGTAGTNATPEGGSKNKTSMTMPNLSVTKPQAASQNLRRSQSQPLPQRQNRSQGCPRNQPQNPRGRIGSNLLSQERTGILEQHFTLGCRGRVASTVWMNSAIPCEGGNFAAFLIPLCPMHLIANKLLN